MANVLPLLVAMMAFGLVPVADRQGQARPQVDALTAEVWDRADKATVRLPPGEFSELPRQIREDLHRRACTIPQQSYAPLGRNNVVRGEFTRRRQFDWAVLCSRNRVSSILVYRRSSIDDVAELATTADRNFMQGSRQNIYFSRSLGVANPKFIFDMNKAFDAGPLPPIDHDGINDAFVEKASTVRYFHAGKWWSLQGAD